MGATPSLPDRASVFSCLISDGSQVADVGGFGLPSIPGLRFDGERVQLARHPNGDPERQGKHTFPSGWNPAAVSWLPGRAASLELVESATQVLVTEP